MRNLFPHATAPVYFPNMDTTKNPFTTTRPRQTIGSLENGRYNPSIQLAFKIARYFHMSIEDIFIYEEE